MFSSQFFPTPEEVVDQMLFGIDVYNKIVLEPSAGKGNIVDVLKLRGAKVLACELNKDLAEIIKSHCEFLKYNFLEVASEEISHIHYIIANPPFDADERHILHMWNMAPPGCEIISLCNLNTITNTYSFDRKSLKYLIRDHGKYENLGNCFSNSERSTEVNIALVHLFKPKSEDSEFEGYFDLTEEYEQQDNGVMKYDEIRDIVNRYVGAVKKFDAVIAESDIMNELISPLQTSTDKTIYFGTYYRDDKRITRDVFKKKLQKSAWQSVFKKMNMQKYVTKSVLENINKFVEQQENVPFTLSNIYKMIGMIVGTHGDRMNKVIVEAFENICRYSNDNSEVGETWKTNSGYKINKNFIKPYICETNYSDGIGLRHRCYEELDDIVKALCHITGKKYEDQPDIWYFVINTHAVDVDGNKIKTKNGYEFEYRNLEFGKWYTWNSFFEIKGYRKGTMHFKFIDEETWYLFNKRVAEIKGWRLPKQTDRKTTGKEKSKKTGIMIYRD